MDIELKLQVIMFAVFTWWLYVLFKNYHLIRTTLTIFKYSVYEMDYYDHLINYLTNMYLKGCNSQASGSPQITGHPRGGALTILFCQNMYKSLRNYTFTRMTHRNNVTTLLSDVSHKPQYVSANTVEPQI